MTKAHAKRQLWPRGRPIPRFKSHAEEERFWTSTDFEDDDDAAVWKSGPLGRVVARRTPKGARSAARRRR